MEAAARGRRRVGQLGTRRGFPWRVPAPAGGRSRGPVQSVERSEPVQVERIGAGAGRRFFMSLVHRYVLTRYIGYFSVFLAGCLCILIVGCIASLQWSHPDSLRIAPPVVFEAMFRTAVPLALPVASFLAALATAFALAQHQELAALEAAGYSRQSVLWPVLACGAACALYVHYLAGYAAPHAAWQLHTLRKQVQEDPETLVRLMKDGVVRLPGLAVDFETAAALPDRTGRARPGVSIDGFRVARREGAALDVLWAAKTVACTAPDHTELVFRFNDGVLLRADLQRKTPDWTLRFGEFTLASALAPSSRESTLGPKFRTNPELAASDAVIMRLFPGRAETDPQVVRARKSFQRERMKRCNLAVAVMVCVCVGLVLGISCRRPQIARPLGLGFGVLLGAYYPVMLYADPWIGLVVNVVGLAAAVLVLLTRRLA